MILKEEKINFVTRLEQFFKSCSSLMSIKFFIFQPCDERDKYNGIRIFTLITIKYNEQFIDYFDFYCNNFANRVKPIFIEFQNKLINFLEIKYLLDRNVVQHCNEAFKFYLISLGQTRYKNDGIGFCRETLSNDINFFLEEDSVYKNVLDFEGGLRFSLFDKKIII